MLEYIELPYMDSSLPQLYTWEALLVPLAFMICNLFAFIPSVIIMVVILRKTNLQTTDNLMTLQMVLVDIIFASWVLVWFTVKLGTEYRLWDYYTCQMEGSMILICGLTWLLSGTFLGYYRFRKIVGKNSTRASDRTFLCLQYLMWIPGILLAISISMTKGFHIMPSFAYCYIRYIPEDLGSKILFSFAVGILLIPLICVIYFYWSITSKHHSIVRQIIEPPDPVYLPTGHFPKKTISTHPEAPVGIIEVAPTPKSHLKKVALKCVAYSLVFLFSFVTMAGVILYQLITSNDRSPAWDSIAVSLVMIHKIMSPVLTLIINDTISHEIRVLLGFIH